MANITVGQIIMDAQRITSRVKDLDALGSSLLVEAEGNNRHIESMRQFQDDIDSLNRISRDKSNADMVNRINQQNPSVFEIRKENRELKACLEDHQRALEVIMHKYREHTNSKVLESKINFKEMYNEHLWKIIREQADKINEMAAVMQRAASLDDDNMYKEIEVLSKLKMENQTLRELLQISKQFDSSGRQIIFNSHLLEDKGIQTEETDIFSDDKSNSSTIDVINNIADVTQLYLKSDNSFEETGNNNSELPLNLTHTAVPNITNCNALVNNEQNNNGPIDTLDLGLEIPSENELNLTNVECSQKIIKDEQNSFKMSNGIIQSEQQNILTDTMDLISSNISSIVQQTETTSSALVFPSALTTSTSTTSSADLTT